MSPVEEISRWRPRVNAAQRLNSIRFALRQVAGDIREIDDAELSERLATAIDVVDDTVEQLRQVCTGAAELNFLPDQAA